MSANPHTNGIRVFFDCGEEAKRRYAGGRNGKCAYCDTCSNGEQDGSGHSMTDAVRTRTTSDMILNSTFPRFMGLGPSDCLADNPHR